MTSLTECCAVKDIPERTAQRPPSYTWGGIQGGRNTPDDVKGRVRDRMDTKTGCIGGETERVDGE